MKKISLVLFALVIGLMLPTIKADAAIVMSGSTTYTNTNFDAVVYWEVFSPFDAASPLGSISDYGYYYQVHNSGGTGDNALTQFGVNDPLKLPVTSAGYLITDIHGNAFNLDGLSGSVAPNLITKAGDYGIFDSCAVWTFQAPPISLGHDGYVLYFTTPFQPVIVNGGVQAGSFNTEGPVPGPAPEPASMALFGLGLLGFVGKVIRKKFNA
ncbi:MAG: PEP-CTERM sorting domain-containing protein [Candidatus Omnitrophica bacterium]|nr:PEP-CTERM sorting domain-containing protein [Candidatus Omnitrophota bacterium]